MARKIDIDAIIERIRMEDQSSVFAGNPASGYSWLYTTTGSSPHGGLYLEKDDGSVIGPFITGSSNVDVVARYTSDAGQSIINGAGAAIIDFEDIDFDTHSAVTTGASWKFTCPAGQAGYYQVNVKVSFVDYSFWVSGERGFLLLYKEGVKYATLDRKDNFHTASVFMWLQGSDIVDLAVGEFVDVRIQQNCGSNLALATEIYVSIAKIKS